METYIEREKFSIRMHGNGITELHLFDNVVVDLNDSLEQERLLTECMPEQGHLLLVITGPGTDVTRESREHANKNPLKGRAMAIVTRSLPQKIVTNFMITIYRKLRPNYPVKMFLRKEKAEEWLLSH